MVSHLTRGNVVWVQDLLHGGIQAKTLPDRAPADHGWPARRRHGKPAV